MTKRKRGWNLCKGQPDGDRGRSLGGKAHDQAHMREIGRRGWRALVRKEGLAAAHDKVREWQIANPTELERLAMDALDALGANYEREVVLSDGERFCSLDFRVGDVALEVDGDAAHGSLTPQEARLRAAKAALCEAAGLRLVRLPEAVVRNGRLASVLRKELV